MKNGADLSGQFQAQDIFISSNPVHSRRRSGWAPGAWRGQYFTKIDFCAAPEIRFCPYLPHAKHFSKKNHAGQL
jgi:hypothetical protein